MNLYYKLKKTLLPENIRMIQQGLCNVQAPSSGWVVALMDIQKNERLLDMCAAPGGKAVLMAELTGDGGTLCAGDKKWTRLLQVVETMDRMHLENIYPLLFDGLFPPFTGHFDKVLLDAPCTGSGVYNHHPEARWIRTSSDVLRMADIQKNLLQSAAQMIGLNGIIVYSTCSLEPEENELQVLDFLKRNPNFQVDPPPGVIPAVYTDSSNFLRITPFDHGMDGMFAARLRKMSQ
jgi:16S rRNA (cytosine967-C5)-methyltransferase